MNNIKVRTKLVIVMVIALIALALCYAPSFPTQACQDLEIMR